MYVVGRGRLDAPKTNPYCRCASGVQQRAYMGTSGGMEQKSYSPRSMIPPIHPSIHAIHPPAERRQMGDTVSGKRRQNRRNKHNQTKHCSPQGIAASVGPSWHTLPRPETGNLPLSLTEARLIPTLMPTTRRQVVTFKTRAV